MVKQEKNDGCGSKEQDLKRETESLILAAQEQAIRTNVIKAKIDNTQKESKCRMCGKVDETVNHIVSECKYASPKRVLTKP